MSKIMTTDMSTKKKIFIVEQEATSVYPRTKRDEVIKENISASTGKRIPMVNIL